MSFACQCASKEKNEKIRTGEDERGDGGDEAGQEGVEGEGADETAVGELEDAGEHDAEHIGVDEADLARRLLAVLLVELA